MPNQYSLYWYLVAGVQINGFLRVVSSIAPSKRRSVSSQFNARPPPLGSHRASLMSRGSLFKRATRTWQRETTGRNGTRDNYGLRSSPCGNMCSLFFIYQMHSNFNQHHTLNKHSMIDLVPLLSPPNILFVLRGNCLVDFRLMTYSFYLTVCSLDLYYKLT